MQFIRFTKIKHIPLLFPLLLVTDLFAQNTDLKRDNLKGKVKSVSFYTDSKLVKTRTYNLSGFETSLKNYCRGNILEICSHDTFMYDSKGNMVKYVDENFIIEKKYDDANNLIESIEHYKFNKKIFNKVSYNYINFKKVRSEQTKYSPNSDKVEFNIIIDYRYDVNGYFFEEDNISTTYNNTRTKSKINYTYDKAQNLIEEKGSNDTGKMQYEYFYKYDTLNRKIEYQSRSFNGGIYTNYNEKFKYDEKGRMVESSHYELDGKLLYKDIYHFDKMGNQIKRSHYYGDVLTMETVDVFNDLGLLTAELEYKSNMLTSKKTFKFDNIGNTIEALYSDANGTIKTRLDYKIQYY